MAIKELKREWSPCQLGYVKHFLLHWESDVKDLPECCVGSIATVSETDNEYIYTADGWKHSSECAEGDSLTAKVAALTEEIENLKESGGTDSGKDEGGGSVTTKINCTPIIGLDYQNKTTGEMGYYTESNYNRGCVNPFAVYPRKGYVLTAKLNSYDSYDLILKAFKSSADNISFAVNPGTPKTFDGTHTLVYESKWVAGSPVTYTSDDNFTVCMIGWRRKDNGAITQDDVSAMEGLLTVTITSPASASDTAGIVERNDDALPAIIAASRSGYNSDGAWQVNKQYTMLVTTDVHGDEERFKSAIKYMDGIEQIDAGICLGDIQPGYFTDNDGTWFTDAVNNGTKIMYPVIGNHDGGNTNKTDKSATKAQQFSKFFSPVLSKINKPDLTKTYYSVNTGYGVTMIALDCHDVPDTMLDDTTFAVSRGTLGYSQAQIDWLVATLNAVPTGNHVLISVHNTLDPATMVEGAWTQSGHMCDALESTYDYPDMIPAIIDAWKNGTSLSKSYDPAKNTAQPTLTVNADFTSRGAGIFAGYMRGHTHRDYIAKMTNYEGQNVYCLSATACDTWQNYSSDLPRLPGDKSEDCITVLAVDTIAKKVKLVRIGSNITFDMVRRDMIAIPY